MAQTRAASDGLPAATDHMLHDGHGSTRALTDATGAVTARYGFDAYGVMLGSVAGAQAKQATSSLYCGEQFDSDAQQYYLRARYYDQQNGRFDRLDPFAGSPEDPQSLHKYAYCGADPVNAADPSGLTKGLLAQQMITVAIIGQMAAQYIARVPAMAANAFRNGGQAIGVFFNQFGWRVQEFGTQVLSLFPRIHQLRPALEGFTRRPDFLLRFRLLERAIEAKYRLPSDGEPLQRMGQQLQQFAQWASQRSGREVVVWALKAPENAAKAEEIVLGAAGSVQGIRFVYGIEGLYQYLLQWTTR